MTEPTVFGQDRLRGKLIEAGRIKELLAYVESISALVEQFGSYRAVLSGETTYSLGKNHTLDTKFLRDSGFGQYRRSMRLATGSFATTWDTGCDVNAVVENESSEAQRIKFYLSLDLRTLEQTQSAQQFMTELLQDCTQQKLSIQTKAEDHAYDSCDIYTWHPQEVAEILQRLYAKYPNIWNSTKHFLQGTLPQVNAEHIGFVQEPLGNSPVRRANKITGSHSNRMGELGAYLDDQLALGKVIDETIFREAANAAHVRPDRPWLLDVKTD